MNIYLHFGKCFFLELVCSLQRLNGPRASKIIEKTNKRLISLKHQTNSKSLSLYVCMSESKYYNKSASNSNINIFKNAINQYHWLVISDYQPWLLSTVIKILQYLLESDILSTKIEIWEIISFWNHPSYKRPHSIKIVETSFVVINVIGSFIRSLSCLLFLFDELSRCVCNLANCLQGIFCIISFTNQIVFCYLFCLLDRSTLLTL